MYFAISKLENKQTISWQQLVVILSSRKNTLFVCNVKVYFDSYYVTD